MLESAKNALRLSGNELDEEVQDLINAAISELQLSGVGLTDINDPLIKRAILTYCKANFGWDNPEAERFQKSFESLKNHLSLSVEYSVVS
jgi:uncharacterized phage protein (predicted DNA packaging)